MRTMTLLSLFFFFFFFQAEDGIRDIGVTGVQTCALPISPPVDWENRALGAAGSYSDFVGLPLSSRGVLHEERPGTAVSREGRSEERRVGKECRSRWSPYH